MSQFRLISTCILDKSATFWVLFPSIKIHLYKEFYKNLPEATLSDKLIKLRKIHNIEREEFAKILNFHWDTVEGWELHNIMPKPENIKKVCDFYNIPLKYFHEYYYLYFNNVHDKIRKWKEKNNYTYKDCYSKLDITHSAFGRVINGRVALSYDLYLKLKELGAF